MKGDADLIVLAVATIPIIIFMIFASQFIVEQDSAAELTASIDYSERLYQQQVAAAVLMQDEGFRDAASSFHMKISQDEDPAEARSVFGDKPSQILREQSNNYFLDVKAGDGGKEIAGNAAQGPPFTVVAASPKKSKLEVVVYVGAQRQ